MHGDKLGWQEKFDIETGKAIKHVEFCCALYRYQVHKDGIFYTNTRGRRGLGSSRLLQKFSNIQQWISFRGTCANSA